jgi:CRP-like cAMP-binding protein
MDTRIDDVARCLAVLPLFQEMTPQELERLAHGCRLRRFGRGDPIFRVGEACEEFHASVTGQVKLFALSPAGQEKVIELIGPGHTFAEALLFTDKPYIVNAQALTDALVLSVHKDAITAEIARDGRFALRMLAGISRRLHGLVRDVQAYALDSGVQRVIGYLLRELPEGPNEDTPTTLTGNHRISLPVSKATIASRLSLTPEYFSRVLRELEAHGLIEMDKRDILIPDVHRLADYFHHQGR